MLKKSMNKVLLVILACFLVLVAAASASAAIVRKSENGMLTPPPPPEDNVARYVSTTGDTASIGGTASIGEMSTDGMNPGDIYLGMGESGMGFATNGDVVINGNTYATQYVQQVGIQLSLQRWTGSDWVTVYNSASNISYNSPQTGWSDQLAVTKGYYYRTYNTHWIDHNGTHEQGNSYSPSQPVV